MAESVKHECDELEKARQMKNGVVTDLNIYEQFVFFYIRGPHLVDSVGYSPINFCPWCGRDLRKK